MRPAALDAAAEAPGGAGVPNRVVTSERRDPPSIDAAAEAPGGAGVPNRVVTSERRDPQLDAAGERAGAPAVPNRVSPLNGATHSSMRPAKALERPPCRTGSDL